MIIPTGEAFSLLFAPEPTATARGLDAFGPNAAFRIFASSGVTGAPSSIMRSTDSAHPSRVIRAVGDNYHLSAAPAPNDLLFPTEAGSPFRVGNYLKRIMKPIGEAAGIPDLTFQAMRRTFATHFQRYGSPKDAQTQLRHSKLEMTG
jgi:hypothetical protein